MEKYVLFVNTATDYLMFPLKAFIGARYASATTIDLFFEKSPLSYKISLTIETGTGTLVALKIAELFSKFKGSVIKFDEVKNLWPLEEVTAISTFTKVVIK